MSPPKTSTQNDSVWVRQDDDSPIASSSSSALLDHNNEVDVVDSRTTLIASQGSSGANVINPTVENSVEREGIVDIPKWRRYAGVAILCFINLLNYMDRYTIAGVLMEITSHFHINNAMAGLLQTVFIASYMFVAPLFGYLGDRYNRIIIMVVGMGMWSGITFASSFIQSPHHFPLFLLSRALVGIGEASYATIAPTLIGDMFVGVERTRMLSVFFIATPIGSGLGYIVGSYVAKALGGWEWALRVTPGLGVVAIFLLIFFCPNPPRGASESSGRADAENTHKYKDDILYLLKNKSFIYVTIGFTFMAFVIGSLTLWGPTYFAYSQISIGVLPPCQDDDCSYAGISFIFGLITCIAGFAGVVIGAEWARRWKIAKCLYADALVCAIGLLVGSPLLCIGVIIAQLNINAAWTFVFFADLSLCLTWTLISDMTLYVTEPSRRSTANAMQLLVGHLFGDAGSPYLLGVIADALAVGKPDSYSVKYWSLQQAMYVTLFACIIGGGGFLMASLYVVKDKKKVDDFVNGSIDSTRSRSRTNGGGSTSTNDSVQLSPRTSDVRTSPFVHTGTALQVNDETVNDSGRESFDSNSDQMDHLLGSSSVA